jgi:pyruvate ferredoxin oxidoreductase gamma subunit
MAQRPGTKHATKSGTTFAFAHFVFQAKHLGKRKWGSSEVLRVRFHGRGGHGIKTASRILGAAAFLSGSWAQDSPIYGAERRGAALAAFTRIDSVPIRERGPVRDPDLILVGDETLLMDPAAGVLAGQEFASAVFVNSPQDGHALAERFGIHCPVLAMDLTALVLDLVGRGSAISAALGAAASALARLKPVDLVIRAVREELADIGLASEQIEKNVEAACCVFARIPPATQLPARPAPASVGTMHSPVYVTGPEGIPLLYAGGNSARRRTGSWRVFRPVIDLDACTRCGICFALCPDGAITLDAKSYPLIDYDNCKGCMMCYEECPIECIREEKEVRAW